MTTPSGREPTADNFTNAVRAAVRLVGFLGAARVESLVREDIEGQAGRALTVAERADVARMVRGEMAR